MTKTEEEIKKKIAHLQRNTALTEEQTYDIVFYPGKLEGYEKAKKEFLKIIESCITYVRHTQTNTYVKMIVKEDLIKKLIKE